MVICVDIGFGDVAKVCQAGRKLLLCWTFMVHQWPVFVKSTIFCIREIHNILYPNKIMSPSYIECINICGCTKFTFASTSFSMLLFISLCQNFDEDLYESPVFYYIHKYSKHRQIQRGQCPLLLGKNLVDNIYIGNHWSMSSGSATGKWYMHISHKDWQTQKISTTFVFFFIIVRFFKGI